MCTNYAEHYIGDLQWKPMHVYSGVISTDFCETSSQVHAYRIAALLNNILGVTGNISSILTEQSFF